MDDEETLNEAVIAPEQAAWATYVSSRYLDRNSILHAHHAFLAGYRVGFSEGFEAGRDQHSEP